MLKLFYSFKRLITSLYVAIYLVFSALASKLISVLAITKASAREFHVTFLFHIGGTQEK